MLKKIVALSVALVVTACGQSSNKSVTETSPKPVKNENLDALLEKTKAPSYFVTITDKDGNIVSSRATDEKGAEGTAEEVARYEENMKDKGEVSVLKSDKDLDAQSSESFFFLWGGASAYAYNYYYPYAAYSYSYYPAYAYAGYTYPYYPVNSYYYGGFYYNRYYRGGPFYSWW